MDRDPLALLAALPPADVSPTKADKLRHAAHTLLVDAVEAEARRPWWQPLEIPVAVSYGVAQAAWTLWVVFVG